MLRIIEETRKNAQKRGFKRLGLLGTSFTMEPEAEQLFSLILYFVARAGEFKGYVFQSQRDNY